MTRTRSHRPWWVMPALVVAGIVALLALWPRAAGVKPVYLSTDVLLYLLVAVFIFMVAHIRRQEHLRVPWLRVLRGRLAMAALVVLSAYVIVGLLDSVHFREPLSARDDSGQVDYSVQVLSVFDIIATPLRTHIEQTYSAPFATRLYTKEAETMPDGKVRRIYPRLKYGGAQLSDPRTQELPDIVHTALRALPQALVAWLLSLIAALQARRHGGGWRAAVGRVLRGKTELPWHVALYTALVIIVLTVVTAHLAMHYHVFGTDKVGNDVFYLAVKSIRTGLVIGTLATLVMLPFAILLGVAAGYFKGWVDDLIQYIYTTLNSIPGVLLIAAAILSIQVYIANHPGLFQTGTGRADLRLLALCVILGITSWTSLCRLLRGETLKLREMDYIEAATAFGVRHVKIITNHILPNVMHIVLIIVVLDFSGLVLAEAVLSYVGVGVDPSTISWGNMINSARLEMAREPMVWWSLAAAFVFMLTLVLSANLFADAVRDAFDPRLREQG
jgi:peptide/nickel transport system permease protein